MTFNCNGLGNEEKRRQVFTWLKSCDVSVIFLQETHSTKASENTWISEWGYRQLFFSHGTSQSKMTFLSSYINPLLMMKEDFSF